MSDVTLYLEVIAMLGEAPETQLDTPLTAECRAFTANSDSEAIDFLRNLRDKVVHGGRGTAFVMQTLNALLAPHPETDEARDLRRARLQSTWA